MESPGRGSFVALCRAIFWPFVVLSAGEKGLLALSKLLVVPIRFLTPLDPLRIIGCPTKCESLARMQRPRWLWNGYRRRCFGRFEALLLALCRSHATKFGKRKKHALKSKGTILWDTKDRPWQWAEHTHPKRFLHSFLGSGSRSWKWRTCGV